MVTKRKNEKIGIRFSLALKVGFEEEQALVDFFGRDDLV